jgi:hypothetical protein
MYFAYTDESGDPAYGTTPTFTVAVVCIEDEKWVRCLEQFKGFRREIRDEHGVNMRDEAKANELIHGEGPVAEMPEGERKEIFMKFMEVQEELASLETFAICVRKDRINSEKTVDPRDKAWKFTIQRFERFADHRDDLIHVLPDEGHYDFIRSRIRKLRQFNRPPSYFGDEQLNRDAKNIIGDCSERDSEESYFIQLADLNAYAAWRYVFPHSDFGPEYWETVGSARDERVNHLRNGPCGIVEWPE